MGWFATSKAEPSVEASLEKTTETTTLKQPPRIKTREEAADAELQQWLATLQAEEKPAPEKSQQQEHKPTAKLVPISELQKDVQSSTSWLPSWLSSKDKSHSLNPDPRTLIPPKSTTSTSTPIRDAVPPTRLEQQLQNLHQIADTPRPTTISCSQAFDYAQGCQFMRGQFLNVYRYGETRQCSHLWSQFWRCMRSRSMSASQKEKLYDEIWLEREMKWRMPGVPSSQDVWEARTEKVENPYPFAPPESLE